jgi:hypothetical protein
MAKISKDILESGADYTSINDAAIQAQLDKLSQQVGTSSSSGSGGGSGLIGPAQPCVPNFILGYVPAKRRIRAQMCASCTPGTVSITVHLCPTGKRTTQAQFQQNSFKDNYLLDAGQSSAGHAEFQFKPTLEYNTSYDLVRLTAWDSIGGRVDFPAADPVFNTTPINTFTTPAQINGPSPPDSTLYTTSLDPTKLGRAQTVFTVIAPLTSLGTAQNWGQAFVDTVTATLTDAAGVRHNVDHVLDDTEATQTQAAPYGGVANRGFVLLTHEKETPGEKLTWVKNTAWSNGEKAVAVGSVPFVAGYGSSDPSLLTFVSIAADFSTPNDSTHALVSLNYTQPTPGVALHFVRLERKLTTDPDANYKIIQHKVRLVADDDGTPGAHTITLDEGVHFKALTPTTTYTLRATIVGVNGAIGPPLVNATQITQVVTPGVNVNVQQDPAAPIVTNVPTFLYKPHHDLHLGGMITSGNFTQPADPAKYVVIYSPGPPTNPSASIYFDLPTYFSSQRATIQSTTELLARYPVGAVDHVDIAGTRLQDLKTVFGNNHIVAMYWYAVNQAFSSTPTRSPDSNTIDLNNSATFLTGSDAVSVVDVSTTMSSPGQILFNGDFLFNDGVAIETGNWKTTLNGPAISIATLATFWDQTNHCVTSSSGTLNVYQKLHKANKPRLVPGDYYSLSWLLKAAGGTPTINVQVNLQDGITFVSNIVSQPNFFVASSGTYIPIGCVFQHDPNDPNPTNPHWLSIFLGWTSAGGLSVSIDRIMMVRGKQPFAFTPRTNSYEVNGAGTDEGFDIFPNATAQGQDLANPTNSAQGRWVNPGQGTLIHLT